VDLKVCVLKRRRLKIWEIEGVCFEMQEVEYMGN
jgi:hypothetical protein